MMLDKKLHFITLFKKIISKYPIFYLTTELIHVLVIRDR